MADLRHRKIILTLRVQFANRTYGVRSGAFSNMAIQTPLRSETNLHTITMNNQQFRRLLIEKSEKKGTNDSGTSVRSSSQTDGLPPTLGSRMRSCIPMTP